VTIKTMDGVIPFYAFFYDTNDYYHVFDELRCGGSCFDYLAKYMDFSFN
jgi:hypothetical protein